MNKSTILTSFVTSTVVMSVFSLVILTISSEDAGSGDDVKRHHRADAPQVEFNSRDADMQSLRDNVDELLELQHRLQNENQILQQRLSSLESNRTQSRSNESVAALAPTETSESSANSLEDQMAVAEAEELRQFQELRDQVAYEEYNEYWASEMDSSLQVVSQRLQDFGLESTEIAEQECRSESCYVEFVHHSDVDHMLFTMLASAPGVQEITFKHVQENGVQKTQAIYKR